jgi:hypothetical protein
MRLRTPSRLRPALDQIAQIRQDLRLVLWALVVLLLPFYLFDSGIPQIADLLSGMLLVILLRTWHGRLPPSLAKPLQLLLLFVVYATLVNVAWSFVELTFSLDQKTGFLLAPTFYVFNGLMLFTFFVMFQRYGEFLLWLTVRLVLTSVLIQVGVAFVQHRAIGRSVLMFNNPNQLGYYALLSACILLLGQKRLRLSTIAVTVGLAACAYLALLSASKAALVSIAGLGIVLVISKLRTVVVALLVFGVLIFTDNPFSAALDRASQRIEDDQSLGFFEERGYDRIVSHPQYVIAGAGEGGYYRFRETSAIGSHELHSSIATLFFCYGVFGTLLFGVFMWAVMARTGVHAWIIVATGFAYGMTHQGLRFRMLWLLLAMVITLRELANRDRRARLAARKAEVATRTARAIVPDPASGTAAGVS